MNKLLFAALIITFTTTISADELRELCNTIGDSAQIVMGHRQNGRSMSELMKLAKGNKTMENIIIAAYDSPRYNTKSYQTKSVENFRDKMFLACIKSTKK